MRHEEAGFPARPLHAQGHRNCAHDQTEMRPGRRAGRANGDTTLVPNAALPSSGPSRRAPNTHLEALPLLPGTKRPVRREVEPTRWDAAIGPPGFAFSALTLHGVV